MASGYIKPVRIIEGENGLYNSKYELTLTNQEVTKMFKKMVTSWFEASGANYNDFINALLAHDIKAMNYYMNQVALDTFSYFDVGKNASILEPERFYHGFVLGLLVELAGEYQVKSNRESGFGRYDVMIIPNDRRKDAFILEFKVHEPNDEKDLSETVASAKNQIEEKAYSADLIKEGIAVDNIYSLGFAFEGKTVLIG